MYYRRKILLALLLGFGSNVPKLKLQKLLFLFSQGQEKPQFNFVPYKYGCYSFQAAQDLSTLSKYRLVSEEEKSYTIKCEENYLSMLSPTDKNTFVKLKSNFGNFSTDKLIKYIYVNYPYYAINSLIAKDKLDPKQLEEVSNQKPHSDKTLLFTIGYEGISVEEYFNRLIRYDVKVLCDVRNFPRSMKFGFSKNQLKRICEGLGILYIHLPGLGIKSEKRQSLSEQSDYDNLFKDYNKTTLKSNLSDQQLIIELLSEHKRVALTCFESNIHQCHRYHLANSVSDNFKTNFMVNHI